MRIPILTTVLFLAAAVPAAAQLVNDPVRVFLRTASCPANWDATGLTRPAQPPLYVVSAPEVPGLPIVTTQAGLDRAFTLSGALNTTARDLAITTGSVTLLPGEAAAIECEWRPLSGQP